MFQRVIIFILLAFVVLTFNALPHASRVYLLASSITAAVVVIALGYKPSRFLKQAIMFLIAGLFILDIALMAQYVNNEVKTNLVVPQPVAQRPELGGMMLDFQNPKISPWRDYFSTVYWGKENTYLFEAPANMPGIFFRAVNMLRYYQPISNYLPRHKSFDFWNQGY